MLLIEGSGFTSFCDTCEIVCGMLCTNSVQRTGREKPEQVQVYGCQHMVKGSKMRSQDIRIPSALGREGWTEILLVSVPTCKEDSKTDYSQGCVLIVQEIDAS